MKQFSETIDGSIKDVIQLKTVDNSLEWSQMFDALSDCPHDFQNKLVQALNSISETKDVPATEVFKLVLCGNSDEDVTKKLYNWWRGLFQILSKCEIPEERVGEYDDKVDSLMAEITKAGNDLELNEEPAVVTEGLVSITSGKVDSPEDYDGWGNPMISTKPKDPFTMQAIEFWVKTEKPEPEYDQYGSSAEIALVQDYLESYGIKLSSIDTKTFNMIERGIMCYVKQQRVYESEELSYEPADKEDEDEMLQNMEFAIQHIGEIANKVQELVNFVNPWCKSEFNEDVDVRKKFSYGDIVRYIGNKVNLPLMTVVRGSDINGKYMCKPNSRSGYKYGYNIPGNELELVKKGNLKNEEVKQTMKENELKKGDDGWVSMDSLIGVHETSKDPWEKLERGRDGGETFDVEDQVKVIKSGPSRGWKGVVAKINPKSVWPYVVEFPKSWQTTGEYAANELELIEENPITEDGKFENELEKGDDGWREIGQPVGEGDDPHRKDRPNERSERDFISKMMEYGKDPDFIIAVSDFTLDGEAIRFNCYYKRDSETREEEPSDIKDMIQNEINGMLKGTGWKVRNYKWADEDDMMISWDANEDPGAPFSVVCEPEREQISEDGGTAMDAESFVESMIEEDPDYDAMYEVYDGGVEDENNVYLNVLAHKETVSYADVEKEFKVIVGEKGWKFNGFKYSSDMVDSIVADDNCALVVYFKKVSQPVNEATVVVDADTVWDVLELLDDDVANQNLTELINSHVRTEEEIMDAIDTCYPDGIRKGELNAYMNDSFAEIVDELGLDVEQFNKDGSFVDKDKPVTLEDTTEKKPDEVEPDNKTFKNDDGQKQELVTGEENMSDADAAKIMGSASETDMDAADMGLISHKKADPYNAAKDKKQPVNEMTIEQEINSVQELYKLLWGPAREHMEKLMDSEVSEDEIMRCLEDYEISNLTQINDLLAYDFEDVLSNLNCDVDKWNEDLEIVRQGESDEMDESKLVNEYERGGREWNGSEWVEYPNDEGYYSDGSRGWGARSSWRSGKSWKSRYSRGYRSGSSSSSSSNSTISSDKLYFGKKPKSESQAVYFLYQALCFYLGKKTPETGAKDKSEYLADIQEFASFLKGSEANVPEDKFSELRSEILSYYKSDKSARNADGIKKVIG